MPVLRERLYNLNVLRAYRQLHKTVKKKNPAADLELIKRAFEFAGRAHREQKRLSGEPYIIHPVEVARTLAEQGLDTSTIAAALLHDVVEDTKFGEDSIRQEFGEEINTLVRAVTKISLVKKSGAGRLSERGYRRLKEEEAAENIRMMLLATARDVRVILIKLADKLHNMRTIGFQKPEKVKRIASEVLDIYAPIASRLGMFRIKSELEDLAFTAMEPERAFELKGDLRKSGLEREETLNTFPKILKTRLRDLSIKARVEARAKHLYSIFTKMDTQQKKLEEIYDLRGVRIIVEEIRDCYGALGVVHTIWPPVPGRFKDYIATPKSNGYQSLHTTVIAPDGKPVEVQIRTQEMDDLAEQGIAAHWSYKSKTGQAPEQAKLHWLKRLNQLMESNLNGKDFMEDLRQDLAPEQVYVFTPRGDVLELSMGATVLDFAFAIHTEIGFTCKGAKINDKAVPLHTKLNSGDRIEIITGKNAKPSPNWLRYLTSPGARQKLRAYYRKKEEDEHQTRTAASASAAAADSDKKEDGGKIREIKELRIRRQKTRNPKEVPIEVAESTDIPVRYAGCCSPVPGDPIIGFITRGRGVTVHRTDCPTLPNNKESDRFIQVRWAGLTEKYPVRIEIRARDRQGLYLELVGAITRTFTNILKAEADIPRSGGGVMKAEFLIEIEHADHLRDIIETVREVNGVISVQRAQEKSRGKGSATSSDNKPASA